MNLENFKKECQRIEEDAIYSSKGHYNDSDCWSKIHYAIGLPMVVLSAWAGFDIFAKNSEYAGYLTLIITVLASLQTFIKADDKSIQHKNSADELNYLKNKVRRLREIKTEIFAEEKLVKELDTLADKYSQITRVSQPISGRAFRKATKGIKEGQSEYLADN